MTTTTEHRHLRPAPEPPPQPKSPVISRERAIDAVTSELDRLRKHIICIELVQMRIKRALENL